MKDRRGAVDMFTDGSAFLGGAAATASLSQIASPSGRGLRYFAEAVLEQGPCRYPFFQQVTIPAGTYPRQKKYFPDIETTAGTEIRGRVYRSIRRGPQSLPGRDRPALTFVLTFIALSPPFRLVWSSLNVQGS